MEDETLGRTRPEMNETNEPGSSGQISPHLSSTRKTGQNIDETPGALTKHNQPPAPLEAAKRRLRQFRAFTNLYFS